MKKIRNIDSTPNCRPTAKAIVTGVTSEYHFLFITDRVSRESNAIDSVCLSVRPSVRLFPLFWTDWPLNLSVCVWGHDHIARRRLKVKIKGQRGRYDLDPRSMAVFLVLLLRQKPPRLCRCYEHAKFQLTFQP